MKYLFVAIVHKRRGIVTKCYICHFKSAEKRVKFYSLLLHILQFFFNTFC